MRVKIIFLLAVVLVCGVGVRAQAGADFNRAFENTPIKVGRYHMQSNAWVNLHQRLLYQARFKDEKPSLIAGEDLVEWNKGVDAYGVFLGKRDPIFDQELVLMNAALSATSGPKLPASIPAAAAKILDRFMPIYKKAQWSEDDRINKFCMSIAVPMLQSAADELIAAHEKAYGVQFPTKIHVDFTALGWQFGAYTVGEGATAHVVIQSQNNPAAQGFLALESLLHEPSHVIVGSTSGAVGADLARISKELGLRPMSNLWHAILFYTSGELTRRTLVRRGVLDYKPIITRMYAGPFSGDQGPLEKYWQAYLDGKMSSDNALREIIRETAPPKKAS